jgi:hypothetical protein
MAGDNAMRRALAIVVIAGLGFGGLAAFAYHAWPPSTRDREVTTPSHPVWQEAQWPFPMDEWGKGNSFRCDAADCGVEVNLYIRAKIGFCNCTTGVSDDDELDRLADFRLMREKPSALSAGSPIRVAWMKGRSRAFAIPQSHTSTLAIAFNDRCDAVVATALVGHRHPAPIEPSVIAFLNSPTILKWAEVTLGL